MATVDLGSAEKAPSPKYDEYIAALYDDPIRPETARRGRWLVGLSLAVILTIQLQATLVPNALFYITLPTDSKAIPATLSFIVLLLLVEFGLRALTDLYRAREFGLVAARYLAAQNLERERSAARAVDDAEQDADNEHGPMEPDPWWEKYFRIDDEERSRLEKLESELGGRSVPKKIRAVRVWLEISVPAQLGILALFAFALQLSGH